MLTIEFNKAGVYQLDELRTEEFVYLAIKEDGFLIRNNIKDDIAEFEISWEPLHCWTIFSPDTKHESQHATVVSISATLSRLIEDFKEL